MKSDKTEEFFNQQIPILLETLKLVNISVNDFTKELKKQNKGNIDAISQGK